MYTLEQAIQKKIKSRIIICVGVLICTTFIITSFGFYWSFRQLNKTLLPTVNNLQQFIISQSVMDNTSAIPIRIHSIETSNHYKISWFKKTTAHQPDKNKINWKIPLRWSYFTPIYSLNGQYFGNLLISGNLLSLNTFKLCIISAVLMIFLSALITLLLIPIMSRIPRTFFLEPIHRILSLLRQQTTADEAFFQNNIQEINEIHKSLLSLIKDSRIDERNKTYASLARQVVHDIRSPLLALTMILRKTDNIASEKKNLLISATKRINDIISTIDTKSNKQNEYSNSILIYDELQNIISEKRHTYSGTNINLTTTPKDHAIFVKINPTDFKRVLSNIINNAIEASTEQSSISVSLRSTESDVEISITDTGRGIPSSLVDKVFEKGFSHNKKSGNGLGLSHAKSIIESANGHIYVDSTSQQGTTIKLTLPITDTPTWITTKLTTKSHKNIAILDDDESILNIWKTLLSPLKDYHYNLFLSVGQFLDFTEKHSPHDICFFIDYNLSNTKHNGVTLIKNLDIMSNTTIVTSEYNNLSLIDEAIQNNFKIFPKTILPYAELFT